MCWHEPVARLKRWECCFDLWKEDTYPHVGVSDSHLGFHLARIISEANPRILVIRRDITQVKESLTKIGWQPSNYCDALAAALDRFSSHQSVAWVPFDGLQNATTVRHCLEHLMPGCSTNESRIRQLIDLNIQADMEVVWQRALESRGLECRILGVDVMPGINSYQ